MRFFNTAGPVRRPEHYCIPPLERFDLDDVLLLIQQKKYFVLHAPRQVGKTSYLLALMEYLNATGLYHCLYFNVETAQAAREDVQAGMRAILAEIGARARDFLNDPFPSQVWEEVLNKVGGFAALNELLTLWAQASAKPLILLVDEIDSLVGDTLIAVLRQLRAGYDKRPDAFPQSVVLCGVRDVRDYRMHSSQEQSPITGGSAFNIKAESLRLGSFTQVELTALFAQHTTETGQPFSPEAMASVWTLTDGQPWLVNALGYEACFKMKQGRDRTQPITAELIMIAKENLILRRETHLDQLADKLREPRVRNVIEPILAGEGEPERLVLDDVQYVEDLGLITTRGQLRIANKIYQEVIPRTLTYTTQLTIAQEAAWYTAPDGRLDLSKLLTAFQQFFREHSEHWVERFEYKEAGPQLLLQAFLQRIINGGGRIEREYGLGRRRTDLLLFWPYRDGKATQKIVIETKLRSADLERTIQEGIEQTWSYMDICGAAEGHLIIFDRATTRTWTEKIFNRQEKYQDIVIEVWGM